jgi:hypothetical protein
MKTTIAILALALTGCATPMHQGPTTESNGAEYSVKPRDGGFDIAVTYSRYQFIPLPSTHAEDCRNVITSLAQAHARREGRKATVSEQSIRTDIGRNPVLGVTTCEGAASAEWVS